MKNQIDIEIEQRIETLRERARELGLQIETDDICPSCFTPLANNGGTYCPNGCHAPVED